MLLVGLTAILIPSIYRIEGDLRGDPYAWRIDPYLFGRAALSSLRHLSGRLVGPEDLSPVLLDVSEPLRMAVGLNPLFTEVHGRGGTVMRYLRREDLVRRFDAIATGISQKRPKAGRESFPRNRQVYRQVGPHRLLGRGRNGIDAIEQRAATAADAGTPGGEALPRVCYERRLGKT